MRAANFCSFLFVCGVTTRCVCGLVHAYWTFVGEESRLLKIFRDFFSRWLAGCVYSASDSNSSGCSSRFISFCSNKNKNFVFSCVRLWCVIYPTCVSLVKIRPLSQRHSVECASSTNIININSWSPNTNLCVLSFESTLHERNCCCYLCWSKSQLLREYIYLTNSSLTEDIYLPIHQNKTTTKVLQQTWKWCFTVRFGRRRPIRPTNTRKIIIQNRGTAFFQFPFLHRRLIYRCYKAIFANRHRLTFAWIFIFLSRIVTRHTTIAICFQCCVRSPAPVKEWMCVYVWCVCAWIECFFCCVCVGDDWWLGIGK